MAAPCLTVRGMSAWYEPGQRVLDGLSFQLREQEAAGLIGWNGAGKTTLIKTLSGLMDHYQAEEIRSAARPVDLRSEAFKRCRYTVFDEDHAFSYFTFREYFSYVCRAYGRDGAETEALIEGFGFGDSQDVLLKDLSTGSRKKVFLITAFALKPKLLLLDEPVNGLDFRSTEYLYRLIAGYKAYGTVLFASHVLESITLTCDRVLVLSGGRISRILERGQINGDRIREALRTGGDL